MDFFSSQIFLRNNAKLKEYSENQQKTSIKGEICTFHGLAIEKF